MTSRILVSDTHSHPPQSISTSVLVLSLLLLDVAVDGVAVDRVAVDGVSMDGVVVDGVAMDGVSMNGAVDGVAMDGVSMDGVVADGVAVDGVAVDGVAVEKVSWESVEAGILKVSVRRHGNIIPVHINVKKLFDILRNHKGQFLTQFLMFGIQFKIQIRASIVFPIHRLFCVVKHLQLESPGFFWL